MKTLSLQWPCSRYISKDIFSISATARPQLKILPDFYLNKVSLQPLIMHRLIRIYMTLGINYSIFH